MSQINTRPNFPGAYRLPDGRIVPVPPPGNMKGQGPQPAMPSPITITPPTSLTTFPSIMKTCSADIKSIEQIIKDVELGNNFCVNGTYININNCTIEPCICHVLRKVIQGLYLDDRALIMQLIREHPESTYNALFHIMFCNSVRVKLRAARYDSKAESISQPIPGMSVKIGMTILKLCVETDLSDYVSSTVFNMFMDGFRSKDIVDNIDLVVNVLIKLYGDRKCGFAEVKGSYFRSKKMHAILLEKLLCHDKYQSVIDLIKYELSDEKPFVLLSKKAHMRKLALLRDMPIPSQLSLKHTYDLFTVEKYDLFDVYPIRDWISLPIDKVFQHDIYEYFDILPNEFLTWIWNSEIFNSNQHLHVSAISALSSKQFKRLVSCDISFYDDGNKYLKIAKVVNTDIADILRKQPEVRATNVDE